MNWPNATWRPGRSVGQRLGLHAFMLRNGREIKVPVLRFDSLRVFALHYLERPVSFLLFDGLVEVEGIVGVGQLALAGFTSSLVLIE